MPSSIASHEDITMMDDLERLEALVHEKQAALDEAEKQAREAVEQAASAKKELESRLEELRDVEKSLSDYTVIIIFNGNTEERHMRAVSPESAAHAALRAILKDGGEMHSPVKLACVYAGHHDNLIEHPWRFFPEDGWETNEDSPYNGEAFNALFEKTQLDDAFPDEESEDVDGLYDYLANHEAD